MSKIRLSEPIFRSVQGEGNRTGVLSVWIRFFGCNLKCEGFFQDNPTDPSTWIVPEVLQNGKNYSSLADLPVIKVGCDSGYSWHPNFKHLAIDYADAAALYADISPLLYSTKWRHSLTKNEIDLCFTGGEPMMNQDKMVEIMKAANLDQWRIKGTMITGEDYPRTVQIETNGTKKIDSEFSHFYKHNAFVLNWNVSPKLHTVSGEKDAVNYEVIESYFNLSQTGCLKFVVNDSESCWKELAQHAKELAHLQVPIYIMPVGATYEQQTDTKVLSSIANRAIAEGYHVSGRLHAILFGNGIGT
jgi:7-carboxy-7-deazaguanine synthase